LPYAPKDKRERPDITDPPLIRDGEQAENKKNKPSMLEILGVAFAALAALFTFGQYDVATDTEKRTIRAYVSAGPKFVVTFSDRIPIEVRVDILNHGQTPASRVKISGAVDIMGYPLPEYRNLNDLTLAKSSPVLHNGENVTARFVSKNVFSANEISNAVENASPTRIFVYGSVSYYDVFDIKHTTNFCSSIIGSEALKAISTGDNSKKVDIGFEPCETHNEAN
jgi:hypothetical protein